MNTLQGFIASVHTTTESSLEVELELSSMAWDVYHGLVVDLEDRLHELDLEHSARSQLSKGRSLKARYRRVTEDDRRRVLRFSPLPSRFSNTLKNLRAYVYTSVIPSTCFVLEEMGRRKVYFLPKGVAPQLSEIVDTINKETLTKLRSEIAEFRASDDYFALEQLLNHYGIGPDVLRNASFHVGDFVVDILPVDFGYSIEMDDFYTNGVRKEHARGLEALRTQIESKHREYVSGVVKNILNRVTPLVEAESLKGLRIGQRLDKLMELCDGAGLSTLNEKLLKPLKAIASARADRREELTKQFFGTTSLKEAVEQTSRQLLLEEL